MRAGGDARAVQGAGGGGVEGVDGEGRFAAAADARDAGEGTERELHRDVRQVVGGGAVDGDELAAALAAGGKQRDFAPTGEVVRSEAGGAGEELVQRALAHDL